MSHKIICIDRACGSGGHNIGRIAAKELGINLYDSNLIELAKEYGGITSHILDNVDEKATNPLFYKLLCEGNENVDPERPATETLFLLESKVIRKLAATEDCIILGRCADYVLKETDAKVLSVFVTAPLDYRIAHEIDVDGYKRPQAKGFIHKTDKRRSGYYNFFTQGKWANGELETHMILC